MQAAFTSTPSLKVNTNAVVRPHISARPQMAAVQSKGMMTQNRAANVAMNAMPKMSLGASSSIQSGNKFMMAQPTMNTQARGFETMKAKAMGSNYQNVADSFNKSSFLGNRAQM